MNILEEQIINIIKKSKRGITKKELKNLIGISKYTEEFENTLLNLQYKGEIYVNKEEKIHLFQKFQNLALGTLKYNSKHKAYVVIRNNHILISNDNLNGAIAGDLVIVKKDDNSKDNACIEKILKREKGIMIFDYDKIEQKFIPYNWPTAININIPKKQIENLLNGTRVQVKISLEKKNNAYNGKIINIIGNNNDPEIDVKTIVSQEGVIINFSNDAINEANTLPQFVSETEILNRCKNGGIDLRDKHIFTIDGENTKDIDDAVSIELLENGNYLLGVHIADVSHYIKENSILDLEARERSTSIYPYNYVIPMLPPCLSNGICSLNPNEDRLAFSCLMEIDSNGKIIQFDFVDSIINSKKKMDYSKINEMFEQQIIHKDYEPFKKDLMLMANLSLILNNSKNKRGFINFEETEVSFEDEYGEIINIQKRKRGMAERMIENFMLAANECAASFTHWQQHPAIYRIHPEPNINKLKDAIEIAGLNIKIPKNINNPHILQNILNKVNKYDKSGAYNELILQAMNRASYSPNNEGHFGLALKCYTHFTSPIRRYPDLYTHRIIRTIKQFNTINDIEQYKKLQTICEYASKQERIADKVERNVEHYKMAEFMEKHIGECFTGFISYISHNNVSVKTDQLIIGKISIESLKQLGYEYKDKYKLYNTLDNTELFIGDKVEIIVKSANKNNYKIEFELKQKIQKQKIKAST